ncbi:hypothetical protein J3F83DRAFT_754015 [Trichoderma novae-zelandiae]
MCGSARRPVWFYKVHTRTISCSGINVLYHSNGAAAVLVSDVARVSGKGASPLLLADKR